MEEGLCPVSSDTSGNHEVPFRINLRPKEVLVGKPTD